MEKTKNRKRIAAELLLGCPEESRRDHVYLAELLLGEICAHKILDSEAARRWPETLFWLQRELQSELTC